MQINDLNSPKSIAKALYNVGASKMRDLYAYKLQELIHRTPQVQSIPLNFNKTNQYVGKFQLNAAKTFNALFVNKHKRINKIICTYVITNTKTGMVYVGSTQDFYNRWKKHYNLLKLGGHTNIRLQEQWDAHEPHDFTIEIVNVFGTTVGLLDQERSATHHFDPAMVLNFVIGSKHAPGWHQMSNFGKGRAARPSLTKRGKQTRARWFDLEVA